MQTETIYFQKFCKNCGCEKIFKRSVYPNGKACQRCVECMRISSIKSQSKPEFKEKRKVYNKNRRQILHELGVIKPMASPLLPAVYGSNGLKRCNKCFEFKGLSLFAAGRKGTKSTTCKQCRREHYKDYKANVDPDVIKRKNDRDSNRTKNMRRTAEGKARLKAIMDRSVAKRMASINYIEKQNGIKREKLQIQLTKGLSCKAHWYNCKHCGAIVYSKTLSMIDTCKKHVMKGVKLKNRQVICRFCNIAYIGKINNAACPDCKRQRQIMNKKKHRRIQKGVRRFRKKYNGMCEKVDPVKVFERDRFKCKLCGIKVQKRYILRDDAAEVDHIIPLSKGGDHTYINTQTLCRKCNQYKSNKLIGQLTIFHNMLGMG